MVRNEVLVRDVVQFVMGQAPPGKEVNSSGVGVPFFRSGEFGQIRPETVAWTTKPLKIAQATDVFVCVVGANAGEVNRGADGAIGRSIGAIRAGGKVDANYLYYFFKSREPHLRSAAQGSAQPVLSRDDLGRLSIDLPPIDKQRAIAGVLGALDDKIESNRRIALNCEQLLSAFAGSARTDVMVPLGSLAQSTRIAVDPSSFGDEVVDHFSIPAFDAGRLPERCRASAIKSGKFSIGKRSILVSRLNPSSPRVWLADSANRPAMCSTEFLVLNPQVGQRMSTIWLAAVSTQFTDEAERRATGTSFSHQRIKPDDALSIEVPDTRLFDEALLVEADDCLERALQARRESASASQLRDALLPELLSGRLRVRDAEEVVEGLDRG